MKNLMLKLLQPIDDYKWQTYKTDTQYHRVIISKSDPALYIYVWEPIDINAIYLQDKYNKSKENKSVLQIKMVGLKIPSAIIIFFYHCVIIIHADGKLDFPVFCVMLINWQCLLPLVSFVLNKHENKMSLAKLLNVITT